MADVILEGAADYAEPPAAANGEPAPAGLRLADRPELALIELLFFAYRDFVGDPDAVLDNFGFGRAHHRVLHFVSRNPGMTVADLLDILKITKQSLGRVLKQLVDERYIESRTGAEDRRQRQLFTTPRGRALALRLAEPQSRRIRAALAEVGPEGAAMFHDILFAMVNAAEREKVERIIADRDTQPEER